MKRGADPLEEMDSKRVHREEEEDYREPKDAATEITGVKPEPSVSAGMNSATSGTEEQKLVRSVRNLRRAIEEFNEPASVSTSTDSGADVLQQSSKVNHSSRSITDHLKALKKEYGSKPVCHRSGYDPDWDTLFNALSHTFQLAGGTSKLRRMVVEYMLSDFQQVRPYLGKTPKVVLMSILNGSPESAATLPAIHFLENKTISVVTYNGDYSYLVENICGHGKAAEETDVLLFLDQYTQYWYLFGEKTFKTERDVCFEECAESLLEEMIADPAGFKQKMDGKFEEDPNTTLEEKDLVGVFDDYAKELYGMLQRMSRDSQLSELRRFREENGCDAIRIILAAAKRDEALECLGAESTDSVNVDSENNDSELVNIPKDKKKKRYEDQIAKALTSLRKSSGVFLEPYARVILEAFEDNSFTVGSLHVSAQCNEPELGKTSEIDYLYLTTAVPSSTVHRYEKLRSVFWSKKAWETYNSLESFKPTNDKVYRHVMGPPGIGKTTVAYYFARKTHSDGKDVLWVSGKRRGFQLIIMHKESPNTLRFVSHCGRDQMLAMARVANTLGWFIFYDGFPGAAEAELPMSVEARCYYICSGAGNLTNAKSEDSNRASAQKVRYWSLDEYREAVQEPLILKRFLINSWEFVEDTVNRYKQAGLGRPTNVLNALLDQKYYLAGISMRYLVDYEPWLIKHDILESLEKCGDYRLIYRGLVGTKSEFISHTVYIREPILESAKPSYRFVSDFVYKEALVKAEVDISTEEMVRLYKWLRNPSFKGHVYELLFFRKIDAGRVKLDPIAIGDQLHRQRIDWDLNVATPVKYYDGKNVDLDCDKVCWLRPVASNNPGWDFVHIDSVNKVARFVQVTVAAENKCDLSSMDNLLSQIKNVQFETVEFAFVTPEKTAVKLTDIVRWAGLSKYKTPFETNWPALQKLRGDDREGQTAAKNQEDYVTHYSFTLFAEDEQT